jgi:hypothetical protein
VLASEVTALGCCSCELNKKAMPPMITLLNINASASAASFVESEVVMIVSCLNVSVFHPVIEVFR